MVSRGRPDYSPIRNNMVNLLYFMKEAYGYDIYKKYRRIFHKVGMRSIYYHLNKGLELGVFQVSRKERVEGDFSWGSGSERTFFKLGPSAKPSADPQINDALRRLK